MSFGKKPGRSTVELIESLAKLNGKILEDLKEKNEIIRGMQLQINMLEAKFEKIERAMEKGKHE